MVVQRIQKKTDTMTDKEKAQDFTTRSSEFRKATRRQTSLGVTARGNTALVTKNALRWFMRIFSRRPQAQLKASGGQHD